MFVHIFTLGFGCDFFSVQEHSNSGSCIWSEWWWCEGTCHWLEQWKGI